MVISKAGRNAATIAAFAGTMPALQPPERRDVSDTGANVGVSTSDTPSTWDAKASFKTFLLSNCK